MLPYYHQFYMNHLKITQILLKALRKLFQI